MDEATYPESSEESGEFKRNGKSIWVCPKMVYYIPVDADIPVYPKSVG